MKDNNTLLKINTRMVEMEASHDRFPWATKSDAMRLMEIWHTGKLTAMQHDDWNRITGTPDITTKVLWDFIRAAVVNG